MWEPQLVLADQGWRVVAPHYRGMDGATGDPPAASVDDFTADLIDLLDRLKIDEAVFAGLSLGGYVAFSLFRFAPRYVRGLVLADTRAPADAPEVAAARKRLLAIVHEQGPSAVADEMVPKLVGETTRRDRPAIVERVRSLILSGSSAAIAGALTAIMTRPDSTPTLSSIHCPTLVIVGDEDTLTPPSMSRDLLRGIAGSELTVIPKSGHLSSLETPAAFNAALARFLEHRI